MSDQANITTEKVQETYKFKTLRGYGKFISGLGWVLVIGGILGLLGGIGIFADKEAAGLSIMAGGIVAALNGLFLVVFGQLTSCFVEIEKNTRVTYEVLRKQS